MKNCKFHTRYTGKRPPQPTIKFPRGCPDCWTQYWDKQAWEVATARKNLSDSILTRVVQLLKSEQRRRHKIASSNAVETPLVAALEASLIGGRQ